MKIKMIDLFKLMLERKAPKKIRVLGIDMAFIETAEWGDYKDDDCYRLSDFRLTDCLNEDVEIIEEPKKIMKWDKGALEEMEKCTKYTLKDLKGYIRILAETQNELQQENKILKENAENNDKVVDKVNWENQLLKKENKQLKAQIEEYQKALDETMYEKIDIENNWNKLKEWVNKHYDYYINNEDYIGGRLCFIDMKDKMQKLEQGSDSNE